MKGVNNNNNITSRKSKLYLLIILIICKNYGNRYLQMFKFKKPLASNANVRLKVKKSRLESYYRISK